MNENYWSDYLDRLIDKIKTIDVNKVTILTGGNGRGKSVARKQMVAICRKKGIKCWAVSMDDRAGVDASRMMVFGRDCEWLPTSINTFDHIDGFQKATDSYGILDEVEIGMSEESQLGIALHINKCLKQFKDRNKGVLIITHSRHLVNTIEADAFINLEGMTKEQWLNREIIPTDFNVLRKESDALFAEIEKRIK